MFVFIICVVSYALMCLIEWDTNTTVKDAEVEDICA